MKTIATERKNKQLPGQLGYIADKPDKRDLMVRKIQGAPKMVNIPDFVNHEPRMPPIGDQGNKRGACTAFTVTAVRGWQEMFQRKFKGGVYDFSEEFIYRQIMVDGGGAYMRDTFKAVFNNGVCREQLMPYDAWPYPIPDQEETILPFKPSKKALVNAKHYKIESYARVQSIDEMCQSVAVNGPINIGIPWQYAWFWPKKILDGYPLIDQLGGGEAGGHAVTVVGYDYVRKFFIIRNSWGLDWGSKGYFLLSFDMVYNSFIDAWTAIDINNKKNKIPVIQLVERAIAA